MSMLSIKRFLPRGLMGRSLLILITPVVLIQILTAYMFFDRHWSKMTMRLASGVAGEISMVTRAIEKKNNPDDIQNIAYEAEKNLDFEIRFEDGAVLGPKHSISSRRVWDSTVAQTLIAELKVALKRPFILDIDFEEKWIRVSIEINKGVLNISLPGRRLFSSSGYIFLLWMIGSSLLLLLVAVMFMRNQIRPIRKLAVAADRFGKGHDLSYFRPSGAREVRQASEAFVNMHKRIRRQIEQRTAMLAGVSHDLRTPLTRLKLQLEMMGESDDVMAMKSDIQEMQRMIEGYLEFVRGDGEEPILETDINLLINKVISGANRQNITVQNDSEPDLQATIQPMAFERALMNLVTNAGKYGKHVWISSKIKDKKLIINIDDDGPGIPEDSYEDVFKPFFRMDSSRSQKTGGVGLGMPIAMDIIHSHGGKLWLEKSNKGGLRVCVQIPL